MKPKKFTGTVTLVHEEIGYGFVTPDENSSNGNRREVYFDISDLDTDSVSEGDKLKFSIMKTDDEFEAKNPTVIVTDNDVDESTRPTTTPGQRDATPHSKKTVKSKGCEGTVTTYFEEKGYGFVTTTDISTGDSGNKNNTKEVFFHISDLNASSVSKGDRLTFGVVETDDGPRATRPTVAEKNDSESTSKVTKTDSADRLGVSGLKDDTQYGRNDSTTSGDVKSFDDERKFR